MKFSAFPKTKLTAGQLHSVTEKYSDLDNVKPPSVDDLAGACGAGRFQVEDVVTKLRKLEVEHAKRTNQRGQISGDVEVDEHGIRSFCVSRTNPHYKHLIPKVKAGRKPPPYWRAYVRVIGARVRGGSKTYLKFLPLRLVYPTAKPPPLSNEELINSRILNRLRAKKTVVFTDGAKAYDSIIKSMYRGILISRAVSHKNMQFCKKVRTTSGHSKLAGTQSIDSVWSHLQKSIPSSIHTKAGHKMNPLIEDYTWSWLYRQNHKNQDGLKLIGKALWDSM